MRVLRRSGRIANIHGVAAEFDNMMRLQLELLQF